MCVVKLNSSLSSKSSLLNFIKELPEVNEWLIFPPEVKEAFTAVGAAAFKMSFAGTLLTIPDLEITKIESFITLLSVSSTVVLILRSHSMSSAACGSVVPMPTWAIKVFEKRKRSNNLYIM